MAEAKDLQKILRSLLGSQGVNVLGIYQFLQNKTVIQETPSIMIRIGGESGAARVIKANSGIECVIEPENELEINPQGLGSQFLQFWTVTLDQHDPRKNLQIALQAIYQSRFIRPMDSPIVRPRIELPNQQGEAPARAILQIPRSAYLPNFY